MISLTTLVLSGCASKMQEEIPIRPDYQTLQIERLSTTTKEVDSQIRGPVLPEGSEVVAPVRTSPICLDPTGRGLCE